MSTAGGEQLSMALRREERKEDGKGEVHRRVENSEDDYVIEDLQETVSSSTGSRLNMIENQLRLRSIKSRTFSRDSVIMGFRQVSRGFPVIHPENSWYHGWIQFLRVWALYSSFFTPMEFGFFRGLPQDFVIVDFVGQLAFFLQLVLQFFVAYRDSHTYRMVYKRRKIALRYLKSHFVFDLLGCMPWDMIYKASGNSEIVRYLLWIRLTRVRWLMTFFHKLERDIRVNYMFARILKLIAVELYCTHTAACIFYYLATTTPPAQEGYTWIGSLKMGDFAYSNFRDIDIWKRYTTSLYFAIITMATVGYGDIHAVNTKEMIFVIIFVSFDMILGAYLVGNMTALIVKGSKTEKFRDKMTELIQYMNRNRLGRDIRNQIKGHLRLQYESSFTDSSVIQDIPLSLRAKISQTLYFSYIEAVPLFKGCSSEFINQVVIRLHEEFFLPGEVLMEQGHVVDQLYFVCEGVIEEVGLGEDGLEETLSLLQCNTSCGEISILCNVPLPYTVRVCELSRLLRLDKQSFLNVLEIYFYDGRKILNNMLQGKSSHLRHKQLGSDVSLHIGKHEAELALKVNSAAFHGDLYQLKSFIRAGANPDGTDYDGRSALHLAASRGFEDITLFLIQEGVSLSSKDKFGHTPLLEAIKNGHDRVASLLVENGAALNVNDPGSYLCKSVAKGETDFLKRLMSNGVDPNAKDYDHRTPLHVAASEGIYPMVKHLLDAGANVFSKDRWGRTPLDEARSCGNKKLIKLLEEAKTSQLCEYPDAGQEMTDKQQKKKCTVFPFHPWEPKEKRNCGIVLWVPRTVEELITDAAKKLQLLNCSCILSEAGGKILDVGLIDDGQRLYLVSEA